MLVVAQISVGCQLPESVPKTTGQRNCLRASMKQISGLKEDSGTAWVEMCFERHKRMDASVLISGVVGNTSGVNMMKLKMTVPIYSKPIVDRIGTMKSLLRRSRFVA